MLQHYLLKVPTMSSFSSHLIKEGIQYNSHIPIWIHTSLKNIGPMIGGTLTTHTPLFLHCVIALVKRSEDFLHSIYTYFTHWMKKSKPHHLQTAAVDPQLHHAYFTATHSQKWIFDALFGYLLMNCYFMAVNAGPNRTPSSYTKHLNNWQGPVSNCDQLHVSAIKAIF
jgi:hypothetical protein